MPLNNNNQKVPSAVDRVAKLPVVRSACWTLSVLYKDTKCSNPSLKALCEGLETRMSSLTTTAFSRVSPVLVKLEPQISVANNVACKGLDWLETSFPVLQSPTDEVVAAAKNKLGEIQGVVSGAANGAVDCVQHTVTWVMSRIPQADGNGAKPSLVQRAISVTAVGLDAALTLSEALMDRALPPTEEDKEKAAHLVEGSEAAARSRSYPVRMIQLTAKLCRRTCHTVGSKIQSVQVWESLSRSTVLVQDLPNNCRTLVWSLQGLPQYLQHQGVSALFFITQMYNLRSPSQPERLKGRNELQISNKEQVRLQSAPALRTRPSRTSVLENGCNVKECVKRNSR
ncbi:perilipin-2 [Nematolebias whitei]|uniref:perilipin-2 n=1 Tax=Nematolebias whitei TaxID=451745 RepID=UPI001897345A|nr:perilipin-2 [Nematolebias whitei]